MTLRKKILVGSASGVALLCATAPAMAADAPNNNAVGEIVVTGIRESLQRAIEVKKTATNQVDAISALDIGKLPDKNIADALQRLPGVNTQSQASGEGGFDENDRVSIRGTSPSLTNVMVDGHTVATGDWFILDQFQTVGRSISFELLPSEVTSGISVYKTQDASIMEGGVAGAIDIQTRRPLAQNKTWVLEASLQAQYNTNTQSTRPQFNGLVGWKAPTDNFGIVVQGFDELRSVERLGQETLGYTGISSSMPIATGHPELIGVQAPTLIGSTMFKQEKARAGGFGAAEWQPNDKIDLDLSGFYSRLTASNINNNYMYWGAHELANNKPTSYTVKDNTLTSAVWPAGTEGLVVDNIVRPSAESSSYYVNLDGKYTVNDHLSFKGQVGYTEGVGQTKGSPSFEVDGATAGISYAPSGNGWTVNPVAGNGYLGPNSAAGLSNDWAWNEQFISKDTEIYGKVDGQWDLMSDLPIKDVRFGARFADHTRKVDGWDRGCTLGANGQCWTSPTMPYAAVAPGPYPSGFTASNLGIPGLLVPGATAA
jgi:iron complex outermembrane receptor protein